MQRGPHGTVDTAAVPLRSPSCVVSDAICGLWQLSLFDAVVRDTQSAEALGCSCRVVGRVKAAEDDGSAGQLSVVASSSAPRGSLGVTQRSDISYSVV